ncbi:MAG: hypothetical protein NVS9B3_00790 [Gemmatimonadaceae bacterium]
MYKTPTTVRTAPLQSSDAPVRYARRGTTLIEIMLVTSIIGLMTVVALPSANGVRRAAGIRAAKGQLATVVAVARASAVSRGRPSLFVRVGNTVRVTADSAGTQVPAGPAIDLAAEDGITLTATRDTIKFLANGTAVGLTQTARFVVARGGVTDSVCVLALGTPLTKGCL